MSKRRKPRKQKQVEPEPVRPRALVAGVLALATLAIGLVAALAQPWDPLLPQNVDRTPPDETAHLVYIRHLISEYSLPVLTTGGGNYEAHQPPLYYVSSVPAVLIGRAVGPGADTPPRLASGEIIAGRIWSVLIAACVVVACYLVGCAVFPRSALLATAVPVFAMLLPGHLVNLAAITNDGLAELFCCLSIWLMVREVREPDPTFRRALFLGAAIGAGLLTKTSCLFLLPLGLLCMALAHSPWARPEATWRTFALRSGATLGVALLMWAGWVAHNLAHYPGDPLVARTFVEVFGRDRATPATFLEQGMSLFGYWRMVGLWTYLSFWGVFGQAMVFMPGWYYLLGTLVALAGVVGMARASSSLAAVSGESRRVWLLLGFAVILVVLQFAKFNTQFFQAQARYLFPAIAPLGCMAVAGVSRLADPTGEVGERARWVLGAAGLVMLAMMLAALVEVASRGATLPIPGWLFGG